ncbi:MAG: NAD(P)/FAD-dependent oxidoreductase [Actinophytocola sp.]|uniref:FAD-dependent oxidoreductase n=1 Tax=Actinophytocola sp. TaxID=1872138 RepID=UPI003C71A0D4
MPNSPFHVLVIGAGTGGLALAQGLTRAGISVAVYERDRTRRDGLQGYRVGIDADGKRALRELLPADLYETFRATCAERPIYENQMTHRMKFLLTIGPELLPEDERPTDEEHDESVSRMTLRQVLLTGVEDVVHFDKDFTHYEQHDDGRVTAYFADGSSATGDLLVSAEGASSKVRRQYLPQARLVDTGLVGVTGKTPLTEETRALLNEHLFKGVTLAHGPKGAICIYHVMRFKWDADGELKHGIGGTDADAIKDWPGMLYDNTRDYIMWGWATSDWWLPEDVMTLRGKEIQDLVVQMTRDWHPNLRRIFELGDPDSSFPLAIRTSEPVEQWETTNVTLLGDAIHTMTPGRGVGANTALRDARLLTRTLVRAAKDEVPLLGAVREYETTMTKYAWDAVIKSRAQMEGHTAAHKGGVSGALARLGMRTFFRVMDNVTPLKRKIVRADKSFRGTGREED